MTSTPHTPPRELCSRSSDGIEVALLWTPGTEQLCVAVVDRRSNRSFDLPVDPRRAMQVFHHPYAYAAEYGLLDGDAEPEWQVAGLAQLGMREPAS
jgi:hypothetical protein